jgi:hypothetical protein
MPRTKKSAQPAAAQVVDVGLRYTGPSYAEAGCVPLPEGWPAADHHEPDDALRAEKLESGMYELATPAPSLEEE